MSLILAVLVILAQGGVITFLGYRLCKARKRIKLLEGVEVRCGELTRMNDLLTSGASVKLTSHERNMILMALDYEPFREFLCLPPCKRFPRDVRASVREKIKVSIKE